MQETTTTRCPDLLSPWKNYKATLHRQTPCHSNRASQLGADCERQLVYWRTRWEDAAELPLETLLSFHGEIKEDVFEVLTLDGSVAARNHFGGTAPNQVEAAVKAAQALLAAR